MLQHCFYVLVFWPGGMCDLLDQGLNPACTPCIGTQNLYHWTRASFPRTRFLTALSLTGNGTRAQSSLHAALMSTPETVRSPWSPWRSVSHGHWAHAGFFNLFFGLLKDLYPPPPPSPKSNFACVLLCLKPTPFSGLNCFPAVTHVNWVKRATSCLGDKRGWPVGLFCIRTILFILHGVLGLRQTVQLGTCPGFLRNCHLRFPRWVLVNLGYSLHLGPALVIGASNLADPTILSRPQNEGFALCCHRSHRHPDRGTLTGIHHCCTNIGQGWPDQLQTVGESTHSKPKGRDQTWCCY